MRVRLAPLVGGSLLLMATSAQALELTNNDHTTLNFDVSGTAAWLHSQESYDQAGTLDEGSVTWQEGAVKYGISGEHRLARDQRVTGALRWTSTGTWGDGDAAGFSDGGERTTKLEDAFLTWHSGALFPALGNDGLAVSAGRQSVIVGDGFLITSDSLNFGKGIADGALNRGSCGQCACTRNDSEEPMYRPFNNNDINWCLGAKANVYNCTVAVIRGVASA